jgi:phosphorylase/glycogen(starch) synthase
VNNEYKKEVPGITVIPRDDFNDDEVVKGISEAISNSCKHGEKDRGPSRKGAHEISRIALWDNLIKYYWEAYDHALASAEGKELVYYEKERIEKLPETEQALVDIHPFWRRVLVQQNIPEKLKPLEELSRNLWWSWTQDAIDLFSSIDPEMWTEVHENPVELLEQLPYDTLTELETDQSFIERLQKVYGDFTAYMAEKPKEGLPGISYFSMEYGIHNSLKTFSGGLGLLAGDYLKEASDYNLPLVGVGLLYRYGYFRQVISAGGEQVALSDAQDFSRLPVTPVRDEHGNWKDVQVVLPGRTVFARIWRVQVGRIPLYLLDTDYEANQEGDRGITHNLYGGDNENRLKQEILLGIGGIRALRSIGLDAWNA